MSTEILWGTWTCTKCKACNAADEGLAKCQTCGVRKDSLERALALDRDGEIFVAVPEDQVADAGEHVSRVMVECMNRWLPDSPRAAAPGLMRRWSQGAGKDVKVSVDNSFKDNTET